MTSDEPNCVQLIQSGDRVQVSPVAGGRGQRYYAQYIGSIPGTSFLITMPEAQGRVMTVLNQQWLAVRLMSQGGLYTFQTTALAVRHEPCAYLHLLPPTRCEHRDVRQWPRVTINEPATLSADTPFADGSRQAAGRVVDISVGGALVEAPLYCGGVDDSLQVALALRLGSFERRVVIPCTIRQVRTREDPGTGRTVSLHGVEFAMRDEIDQIFIFGYVYEQIVLAKTRRLV